MLSEPERLSSLKYAVQLAGAEGSSVLGPLGDLLLAGMIVEAFTPDEAPDRSLSMRKADLLHSLAKSLAAERPYFFQIKGPGVGDRDTADFMKELRARATASFKHDYSENKVCGENNLCVDFYFREEETIVEIALGLRNPLSEYERDILKAIMAKEAGNPVAHLLFISKPGAINRLNQAGARSIALWAQRNHGILIEVRELSRTL